MGTYSEKSMVRDFIAGMKNSVMGILMVTNLKLYLIREK